MTTILATTLKEYLLKLRAATEKWHAQVLLYLVLMIVFCAIDQLIVGDVYDYFFLGTGFVLNYLFMGGNWIPAFANVVVIVVATRIWTLIGYLLAVAVLTYFLAVPYYFMSGGEARYGHDSFGVAGAAIWWMIVWFWSSIAGLVVKSLVWRRAWLANSKPA